MEEHLHDDSPTEPVDTASAAPQAEPESPAVEEASSSYLGRWNRLISTTNWEKGRIICEWRGALTEAGAPIAVYTDEAWSRRVGNVTTQHVGRLRRVYQRFGSTCEQYAGLYWSHFQAALDWPDAEMWLEGAVQSGWSVAQMRQNRWEAIGAPPEKKPREEDVITSELDEDVDPADDPAMAETMDAVVGEVRDAESHGADRSGSAADEAGREDADCPADEPAAEPVRPFENLVSLPPDLNEAFEAFKLGILHHKLSGWQEVSCDDLLAALSALRELALAPADG